MKSYINFFDMWYIITINNKNDKRITRMLRNTNQQIKQRMLIRIIHYMNL